VLEGQIFVPLLHCCCLELNSTENENERKSIRMKKNVVFKKRMRGP